MINPPTPAAQGGTRQGIRQEFATASYYYNYYYYYYYYYSSSYCYCYSSSSSSSSSSENHKTLSKTIVFLGFQKGR